MVFEFEDFNASTPPSPESDDESGTAQVHPVHPNITIGERKMESSRKRAVLTNQQAAEIFQLRINTGVLDSSRQHLFTSRSAQVSKMYGVSPKAVRDIWNMRTWRHATKHLWTEQDCTREDGKASVGKMEQQPLPSSSYSPRARCVGRPRGVKDSKPRKLKAAPISCQISTVQSSSDSSEEISYHVKIAEELGIRIVGSPDDASEHVQELCDFEDIVDKEHGQSDGGQEELMYRVFPFFLHLPAELDCE